MPSAMREVLTVELLEDECHGDCEWIDDSGVMSDRMARLERERELLLELPDGFEVERARFMGCSGARGFELALFDARGRPRRRVGIASRRYIGRPLVSWGHAERLVDSETALAFSVIVRLAAT